ncbi:trace amine-associated receptor 13c-like [Erpetoichthys calabaricus]|uniref:trace amine-associated receptor 13c-like n=1 Tax=Erpetoichthys calabaricus TaxID=27687 RepID=UPI0022349D89|nr:trace amine-associated receptor 13c-like [Erpetoichthys calabaricus]
MNELPVYGNLSANFSYTRRSQSSEVYLVPYFFTACLLILTACGNLLVIISIAHFKQLHTSTNILILSLAFADFLIGIFAIPFMIVKTIENCWRFGKIFCFVYNLLTFQLTSVSVSNLVFIAADRYVAVCDPLHYSSKITIQVAGLFIALSWVFSLFYTLGIVCLSVTDTSEGQDGCENNCFVVVDAVFVIVDTVITFVLPCSTMVILYLKIFIVAKRHAKVIDCKMQQDCIDGKRSISKRSERKAAKTLGIVMGAFLFCWAPYFISGLTEVLINITVPTILKNIFIWLAYFNSYSSLVNLLSENQ